MTLPREERTAIIRAGQLLEDLLVYPRIPKEVRDTARRILRHHPAPDIKEGRIYSLMDDAGEPKSK